MKRHGFFSPFPHAHNLFTQFNLTLALPNPLSSPLPPSSPLSCPRLHWMIFTAKYVRVRLTNIKCFCVTYVTQDGIWTAFSHPLPPSHMETGNVPYASRATAYPRQQHYTFAFLPLFSISTLTKILTKKKILTKNNDSLSLICVSGLTITIHQKKMYFQTLPPELRKQRKCLPCGRNKKERPAPGPLTPGSLPPLCTSFVCSFAVLRALKSRAPPRNPQYCFVGHKHDV